MGDYCDLFFVSFLYFCSRKLKTSYPVFYFINQINYHNEEFIIVCVGSGGAGADGV